MKNDHDVHKDRGFSHGEVDVVKLWHVFVIVDRIQSGVESASGDLRSCVTVSEIMIGIQFHLHQTRKM